MAGFVTELKPLVLIHVVSMVDTDSRCGGASEAVGCGGSLEENVLVDNQLAQCSPCGGSQSDSPLPWVETLRSCV